MRLVQQSLLFFQEGNSDKVYEVDLCEVGEGLFVVNFRYGRRGANLREGTKTESAVDESKARAVFAKLVASKEAKGYSATHASPKKISEPMPVAKRSEVAATSVVAKTLLAQLAQGSRGDRPLERVIWRVGELGLHEAEPLLLEILALPDTPKNHIRTYSTIWALARCGGSASVAPLSVLRNHKKLGDATKALIAEVLRQIGDEALQSALQQEQLDAMREPVREAVVAGDSDRVQATLLQARDRGTESFPAQLLALYRHGAPCSRPTILEALRTIPLQRDRFWAVRSIFKTAELRRDAQVFGLLAYRFETTRANPSGWHDRRQVFKDPTRRYLRRRVARTLRHLGQDASPDFIPMAVGLLLPFKDEDASAPRRTVYEHWNYATHQTSRKTIHWGPFAGLWALNSLLYSNSDRQSPDMGGKAWRSTSDAASGSKREEAFPELWDARPEALLHLLDESRCEPVHEMAAKALRANPKFCAGLDIEALTVLLQAPYEITAQLGFDLIKSRPIDGALVWLLTGCRLAEARDHAHRWLRACSPAPFNDTALWATLILSPYEDNRNFVRSALAMVSCNDAFAQTVIGRVVAELKRADDDAGYYSEAAQILLAAFPKHARSLGEEVLRDLLEHDVLAVQEVGAELLLENDLLATKVPEDLLVALIDSEHPSIRTIGIKLLDKKPDPELSQYPELFIHLALHDLVDLRESCRPTINRLAAAYPNFGTSVASALCEALLRKLPKGVPANVVVLLRGELQAHLPQADTSQTMRLLKAKSPHARELGALYLKRLQAEELTLFDIVSLASHEMLSIREAAWTLCEASVDRFRVTMPAIARLLDAKWQDSREFALRFIKAHFGPDDLGPAALIAICDSVRPEIQRFGQELILKNFQDQDGHEYLAKLSEHPSTKLQLFVTNYLVRYAASDAGKLEELSAYFLSVLSRVNHGGVAKRRVLHFLAAEGLKSPEAASIVSRVLTRQSVTIAVQNKASIIEAMVAIAAKYPQADLPIRERAPEARHAV